MWSRARDFSQQFKVLSFLLIAALSIGCGRNSDVGTTSNGTSGVLSPYAGEGPFQIVTSTGMVRDLAAAVAGERATVTSLMGSGVDPHLYKPARGDVRLLKSADLVFYSGLGLEGRMEEIFENLAATGKPLVAVTEGIDRGRLHELQGSPGHYDPHVWMDVALWIECLATVEKRLCEFDPPHADEYHQRAEKYREKLTRLDKIGAYSVQGVSTDSEAGVGDINRLVDYVVTNKIPAVFFESSVNPKSVQAVIAGASQRGHRVTIGGELFSDAMGAAETYEGTYIGMLDHNATMIARALGGQAPPGGMDGKLTLPASQK